MKETRFYRGIYKVEIIKQAKHSALVKALEPIPLTSIATIQEGEEFLTISRLLHKQKKDPHTQTALTKPQHNTTQ